MSILTIIVLVLCILSILGLIADLLSVFKKKTEKELRIAELERRLGEAEKNFEIAKKREKVRKLKRIAFRSLSSLHPKLEESAFYKKRDFEIAENLKRIHQENLKKDLEDRKNNPIERLKPEFRIPIAIIWIALWMLGVAMNDWELGYITTPESLFVAMISCLSFACLFLSILLSSRVRGFLLEPKTDYPKIRETCMLYSAILGVLALIFCIDFLF